jgi:hypothetical protein
MASKAHDGMTNKALGRQMAEERRNRPIVDDERYDILVLDGSNGHVTHKQFNILGSEVRDAIESQKRLGSSAGEVRWYPPFKFRYVRDPEPPVDVDSIIPLGY